MLYLKAPNHPTRARHLSINQEALNQLLRLENTTSLWKKLIEPEKITKILEKHQQYWEMFKIEKCNKWPNIITNK